ncbi:MAG: tetratricopeptide repeat protein [Acidobacteria bacterium]|nr:tetratricopeptide repeat protein [Acidobacteriota bacterium]NIM61957.1 tetratricopeptide repeat protein [Acidobacteriota bacterium]NIO58323.1 tetratricopeptide repeat protein [Acidobacteriota bacterium]NIQ29986.1 tetratricopeptide repeat protein [Acidobacteriota bacterium]NIQ83988.1 tetratricopeptide repeat protein [Acidobacteriota bacterium]
MRLLSLSILTLGLLACAAAPEPLDAPVGLPVPDRLKEMDPDLVDRIEQRLAALRRQPQGPGNWMGLGLLYEAHEIYEPALECYARAVELDPEQPRAWYHLALMQNEAGDLESAVGSLMRVGDLETGYAPARWRRGFLLLELGRLDEADGAFREALEVAPRDVAAQAGLARVALNRGEPAEAARILEELLAAGARHAYLHHLLGEAYRQLGQWERAEIELMKGRESQAVWHDPWALEALNHRIEYYTLLTAAGGTSDGGQPDAAIPVLEQLLRKKPDDRRTLSSLSRAYLRTGRTDDALALLDRMRELYPDHFEAELNLAGAHEFLGDLDRALGHADRAIELNPDYAASYRRRASILQRQRRLDAAADAYDRAVRLAPNDRAAWRALGDCRLQLRQWEAAAAGLEHARRLDPEDAEVLSKLGFARMELGDLEGAEAVLLQAVSLAPEDARAANLMLARIRQQLPRKSEPDDR